MTSRATTSPLAETAHLLDRARRVIPRASQTLVLAREPHPGLDPRPVRILLQQERLRRSALYNGSNFISYAHAEGTIDQAIAAYDVAFEVLAGALQDDIARHLDGPPVAQLSRTVS